MAFLVSELIDRTLVTTGLDTENDIPKALKWLEELLLDIETRGYWRFLLTSTTYQTENGVQSVSFSAAKFPSAAITDYSKGLSVESDALTPVITTSYEAIRELIIEGYTGDVEYAAYHNGSLYVEPKPDGTNTPILTLWYYKNITLPTDTTDDIEDDIGLVQKWQPYLLAGMKMKAYEFMGDETRQQSESQRYEQGIQIMLADGADYYTPKEQTVDKPSLHRLG